MLYLNNGIYELKFEQTIWEDYLRTANQQARLRKPVQVKDGSKLLIYNFRKTLDIFDENLFKAQFNGLLKNYFHDDFHMEIWPDEVDNGLLTWIIENFEERRAKFLELTPTKKPPTLLLQYDTFSPIADSQPNTPSRRSEASPHASPRGSDSGLDFTQLYVSPPRPGTVQADAFEARAMTPPQMSPRGGNFVSNPLFTLDKIEEVENHEFNNMALKVFYYDGNISTYACQLYGRTFYFTLSCSNSRVIFWSNNQFFNTAVINFPSGIIGHEVFIQGGISIKNANEWGQPNESLQEMINRGYMGGFFT